MNGKNLVQLIGFVGQDLRETRTQNGHRVAIRVATHSSFTNKEGRRVDQTTWHNIVAWEETADYAGRNLVKGSKIMVEGRLVSEEYMSADGQKRSVMYIKAYSLLNLDR
jgi:single-strand DNA-binding protein